MYPLSHALARKRNNFDLLRLFGAMAVVYGYAFLIQSPDGRADPVWAAFGFDSTGSLGIYAFFLISGILVTASFERQRSAGRFVMLRIARVWPPVMAAMLLVIFVVGPVLTTLPLRDYFASSASWANLDNFSSITRREFRLSPGVFTHGQLPDVISQPLWTLTECYFMVLVAGMAGLLSSRWRILGAALLGVAAWSLRVHFDGLHDFGIGLRDFSSKPDGYSFWPEYFFLLGVVLYGWRDGIRVDGWSACLLVMTFLAFRDTAGAQPLFYLTFVYGLLWLGTTPMLRRFAPRHDYSFGICIYGLVVQQTLASIAPQLNHLAALAIGAPFILAFAYLSWHGMERPVLNWCRRRLARAPNAVRAAPLVSDASAR